MVREVTRTPDTDSDAATGFETLRHMIRPYAGSAKIRTINLLKKIIQPVEWNSEKSKDLFQRYPHWMELISKNDAFIGDNPLTQ